MGECIFDCLKCKSFQGPKVDPGPRPILYRSLCSHDFTSLCWQDLWADFTKSWIRYCRCSTQGISGPTKMTFVLQFVLKKRGLNILNNNALFIFNSPKMHKIIKQSAKISSRNMILENAKMSLMIGQRTHEVLIVKWQSSNMFMNHTLVAAHIELEIVLFPEIFKLRLQFLHIFFSQKVLRP